MIGVLGLNLVTKTLLFVMQYIKCPKDMNKDITMIQLRLTRDCKLFIYWSCINVCIRYRVIVI